MTTQLLIIPVDELCYFASVDCFTFSIHCDLFTVPSVGFRLDSMPQCILIVHNTQVVDSVCILLQPYSCWFVLTHLIINEVGLIRCIICPHPVNFF